MNNIHEIISQAAITVLSSVSIWAFAGKRHRLGFICGLCGQPFWLYSTWTGGLWGMFIVSLWFTLNHIRGLFNHRATTPVPNYNHKPPLKAGS